MNNKTIIKEISYNALLKKEVVLEGDIERVVNKQIQDIELLASINKLDVLESLCSNVVNYDGVFK